MGRWWQQGWDPEYDPDWEPPRTRAPPQPSSPSPLGRQRRLERRRQRRRARRRDSSPVIPLEQLGGPPVSWEEFAEDDPRHRWSPDSRNFERDPPTGPMLEQDEQGRWILLLRWGSPRGMLVHRCLTRPYPLTPQNTKQMMREQFPGITEGFRLGVASWRHSGLRSSRTSTA